MKKFLVLLAMILACGFSLNAQTKETQCEQFYKDAKSAYDKGDYEVALIFFNRCKTDGCTNADFQIYIDVCNMKLGEKSNVAITNNTSSSKRQSVANCAKNTAFGLDIGIGGSFYAEYSEKLPTFFAPALGIRVMHHFNPYFGIDFLKINWITDVWPRVLDNRWTMRLQIMSGIRGNSPAFFKCMSVYSAFRLGYGIDFRLLTLKGVSHFEGLSLETELGLNLSPTVFAGFAYNYHKYFVKGVDSKVAMHTLSFRLGFNLGKSQEAMKTEKARAEVEKVTKGAENIIDIDSKAREIVTKLMFDGYFVCTDQIVDLKQSESGSHIRYFEGGAEYIIICFSDDPNVLEIRAYLQRMNGKIAGDNAIDRGEITKIHFKPKFMRRLKVVTTNLSSRTPNSASEFRMIIAFKN